MFGGVNLAGKAYASLANSCLKRRGNNFDDHQAGVKCDLGSGISEESLGWGRRFSGTCVNRKEGAIMITWKMRASGCGVWICSKGSGARTCHLGELDLKEILTAAHSWYRKLQAACVGQRQSRRCDCGEDGGVIRVLVFRSLGFY